MLQGANLFGDLLLTFLLDEHKLHFMLMLFAAYLTIIISVCMPLFQKQDNSEVIKIQQQLAVMQEEVHDLKSTDKQLLEVLNNMSQNPYDSSAVESLLEEIKEDISNID